MGVNVSKPLTADHGSPFFLTASCMFRAVMSTARAASWCILSDAGPEMGTLTVTGYMGLCVGLGDITAVFADDHTQLD